MSNNKIPALKIALEHLNLIIDHAQMVANSPAFANGDFSELETEEIIRQWIQAEETNTWRITADTLEHPIAGMFIPADELERAHIVLQISKTAIIMLNVHDNPRYVRLDISIARSLCASIAAQTDQSVMIDLLAMPFTTLTLDERAGLVRCYNAGRKRAAQVLGE